MYKNRILQLHRLSTKVGSKLQDPLISETTAASYEQNSQQFQQSMIKMEKILTGIQTYTEKMTNLKDAFKKAKSQNQSSQITAEMQTIVVSNNKLISEFKKECQSLSEMVESMKKKSAESLSAKSREIVLRHSNLISRAQKLLNDSRLAQDNFKLLVNSTVKRHINFIDKDLTQQQKQQITQNPEKIQQLLQQKLNNQASTNLKNNVADIQNKYKDILKLQKTINECFQLMQDLAILVEYQGEQLNRIEMELDGAKDFVEHGNSKLIDAKKHHKSANKKICWIIMLVMVLIAVIVIPVLVTQLMK